MQDTTTAVTASTVLLSTACHLALYGAPEVTADDGRTFTPTRAIYTASRYERTDETRWTCHLDSNLNSNLPDMIYLDLADVPLWVPAPPEGWDAGIRLQAERGVR